MDESRIEPAHYDFSRYVNKRKWSSLWHQAKEITVAAPASMLEIGVGSGLLGALMKHLGVNYESLDVNADLKPDHVGSVTEMPFESRQFDLVACFQVLEHLPYSDFLPALTEISRVASSDVIISLPDAQLSWSAQLSLPILGTRSLFSRVPGVPARRHAAGGSHHWEINKQGYPLQRILADMAFSKLVVNKTYRTLENPRHRFFICQVDKA